MSKIVLKNVRINYPRLAVAQENRYSQDGKKFYSAQIVIAEDDKAMQSAVVKGIKEAFVAKFGDKAERVYKAACDNKNTRGLQHDEDKGYYYLNAKRREENGAPVIFSADLKRKLTLPEELPTSGDYVDVVLQSWCYDVSGSKGVAFELVSIHYVKEGEPFAGAGIKASADDFEALASDNNDEYGLGDFA